MAKTCQIAHYLMMSNVFIYALKDPDTGQIRYVGASINPTKRFKQHLQSKETNHRAKWIKSLRMANLMPVLGHVDEVPEDYWQAVEAAYIQFYRNLGCDLVNGTDGGEGVSLPGEKHPRFGKTGKKHPMFGKNHSFETRARMMGKKRSSETREKMSAARRGEKNPAWGKPGTRLGKTCSPETIARMSASQRLRQKDSSETKERKSAAAKLREEKKRQAAILAEMWD